MFHADKYRPLKIELVTLPFVVLTVLANSHPLEAEYRDQIINPKGLASLEWGTRLQGLENLQRLPEDLEIPQLRGKRLTPAADEQKFSKSYQACAAPGDKNGHCRHLRACVLEEFRTDIVRFMDYFCVIEQTYVGVCCPDRAEILRTNFSNREDTVAGPLPAIATDESEKESKNSTSEATRSAGEPRGPRGCGVSTKSRMRIVGGRPADPQEWPWIAALLREHSTHYCGGVLVTDRHVLTAAHCVYQYKTREIKVRLGEYDFRQSDETRALDFRVSEIRQHLGFDPATYEHDIAVIKIHRPTPFNNYVWPICLPPVGLTFENKSAIVTGWGTQYFGGPASAVLMEVAVPIWPQKKCVRSFNQRIPETSMCAAAYDGGRDSCQGDSGGPLLHQLGNGRWVNVGIVSWGIRCGEPGHPGIYTRVNSYLDWIFANAIF
ncbi:proclotting enzyme isoform X2 [Athalia rosae]|uniref:proclotting enzyme isoform X2 n=1 Tax=Athalia rosae TaxID=37344 RepID=UPI0020334BBB|nr:proclotting enzyme isoform X2 [Athalia rosae]